MSIMEETKTPIAEAPEFTMLKVYICDPVYMPGSAATREAWEKHNALKQQIEQATTFSELVVLCEGHYNRERVDDHRVVNIVKQRFAALDGLEADDSGLLKDENVRHAVAIMKRGFSEREGWLYRLAVQVACVKYFSEREYRDFEVYFSVVDARKELERQLVKKEAEATVKKVMASMRRGGR